MTSAAPNVGARGAPRRRGRLVTALLVALVLVGCDDAPSSRVAGFGDAGPVAVPAVASAVADPEPATDAALVAELDLVLATTARAFATRDATLLDTVLLPGSPLADRWPTRLANLGAVPLVDHEFEVAVGLGELAIPQVLARHEGRVTVRWVIERFRLDGYDDDPAEHALFLTFVATDDGWRIASDTDAEPLGLVSDDHLWDQGPVVLSGSGPIVALHHPDAPGQAKVDEVVADAGRALATASARWPLPWPERVPVIIPRDQDELGELLHVTFALDDFIAFATSTATGELGDFQLTGARIVVNSSSFLQRSATTREQVLVHELLHIATRPVAGPQVPSWLDEGVAQAIGERNSSTGTSLLAARFRNGGAGLLPTDAEFTAGGRDRTFLSYQQAWGFTTHLVKRFGVAAVADFYAAAGAGSAGLPGTESHNVDRAAHEVFGVGLDELRTSWATAGFAG